MKKFLTALATAGLLVGVLGIPAAKTAKATEDAIYVAKSGTVRLYGNNCKNPNYTTIQAAIDNSVDDQVIVICPGLWKLTDTLTTDETTGLVLQGVSAAKTILDGGDTTTILETDNSGGMGAITLRTLTVQNGRGYWKPAVSTGDFTCDRVTFKNNYNDDYYYYALGGALWVDGDATFNACSFIANTSNSIGGAAYISGTLTDVNSVYKLNVAGDGGALFIGDDNNVGASINGSTFTLNHGDENLGEGDGGAINFEGDGDLVITASTFTRNKSDNDGGAILVGDGDYDPDNDGNGNVIVYSSKFIANQAWAGEGCCNDGGAIGHEEDGAVSAFGSLFQANQAGGTGGAIDANYVTISGNRFIGNHSYYSADCGSVTGGWGGAAMAWTVFIGDPNANVYRGNRDLYGLSNFGYDVVWYC